MGVGTPCRMPPGSKRAIHRRVRALKAQGVSDLYEMAEALQGLWPGATANHVRGVLAGLASAGSPANAAPAKAEPWKPGDPKPLISYP